MKIIELELQKRLLLVEAEKLEEANEFFLMENIKAGTYRVICKGSELTEEITDDLVHGFDLGCFVDYNHHNPRSYKLKALESFVSAIEAKGYYWGENPIKHPEDFDNLPSSLRVYCEQEEKHFEAESKTFNPDKTVIFEIL